MPTAETPKSNGKRIVDALDEVLDWTKGNGTLLVTLPGQPAREMTREEYEAERVRPPMPPANTTQPLDWRPDGAGGQRASQDGELVGAVWPSGFVEGEWSFSVLVAPQTWNFGDQPTASAARSFVERFVMEAGQ